ncbi:MAG: peptidyl-prolyl cis-trans isomerase [Crocinitomicaceae bacterium]|nr:peptidyl-prolyl cis-trans isomerase [Crocinitomicaceae bacterium]MCF8433259.1 peptidyl-prolyl cis-trans isomerase [Crocinitomicaceae bacterium]
MKKQLLIVLSLILSFGALAQKDPVLLEINGKPVTKSEFLQIYLKNNNDPKYDKVSLDEYLELFKKFKLKVAEAEALGYDTIPKLKKELDGYRKQLALPYLIDSAKNEALVKEAYDRTKNEVRASHILIRLESNASPADTLSAYNRIMSLKKRIENGEAFENVAKGKNGSDDPSAANNGGDVGFFTAFQMVYPFEDMAYNTPVNNISEPFRTRFGYHILKVTDKRPARGTIKTAHIMVAVSKDASKDDIQAAEKKINELYEKLKAGENFEALASDHSDDPSTSNKGGVLPQFGTGTTTRMVPVFEDVAFSLKNDGDFSSPVRTEYGFHIIKRLEWKDVQVFTEMKKELQGRVNKDERSKKTQDSFVSKLKNEYGYKDYSKKALKWFIKNIDSTYYVGKWNADKLKSNKPVFTLGKEKFTQQQFANYMVVNYRNVRKDDAKVVIKQQFLAWEKEAILASEEGKLAGKYPEFKALVNEYHDGILLYEIMTDKVWNKAMKDTTGLREFFNVNRSKYMWGNRVDAVVYECLNMDIANEVTKMLKNDTINSKHVLDKINKDSELNLRVRTNKFDKESTSFLKGRDMKIGLNKAFELDGKFYIIKVTELLDPKEKEFSEAKGAATSDYQNFLEKNWLEELAKKHAIKINYDVLYSLGK